MWLHVPRSLSAPESVASNSGSNLLGHDAALWVLSSGMLSLQLASSLQWSEAPWIALLYGTISQPSTADRGAAEWISSLRAFPARVHPSQENASASTMSDGSGPKSGESSTSAKPRFFSSRMCPDYSPSIAAKRSDKSSTRWPRAGGLRNGTTFPRCPSARRTFAIVSSCSLPTPTASTFGSSQNGINEKGGAKERPSAGSPSLRTLAATGEIRARLYPTPCASDAKRTLTQADRNRTQGPTLHEAISRMSSTNGESEPNGGGLLNPCFVEWMMGLPINWTRPATSTIPRKRRGSTRAVTPSSGSPPLQLSMFCGDASPAKPAKEPLDDAA